MQRDARPYIKSCHSCQFIGQKYKTSESSIHSICELFHKIPIDCIWAFADDQKEGYKYGLIAVEHLTKWPILREPKDQTAKDSIRFCDQEIVGKLGSTVAVVIDSHAGFSLHASMKAIKKPRTIAKFAAEYRIQSDWGAKGNVQTAITARKHTSVSIN